jgi:CheY-like chemotaxis protein
MPSGKTIVAVLNDLMFRVKIEDAAKRAGFNAVFALSQREALERAKDPAALVLLDLNFAGSDPLDTIKKLKASDETKGINVVGYVSHVQVDLKQAAQEAGCDVVLARSALSQSLPAILQRYAARG